MCDSAKSLHDRFHIRLSSGDHVNDHVDPELPERVLMRQEIATLTQQISSSRGRIANGFTTMENRYIVPPP